MIVVVVVHVGVENVVNYCDIYDESEDFCL